LVFAIAAPSSADFWEDFDRKYQKHIEEETELFIQHKKEKYVPFRFAPCAGSISEVRNVALLFRPPLASGRASLCVDFYSVTQTVIFGYPLS
jgi:hypothetical protein